MPDELINDIAILPRTRTVKGHKLVFDPQYYTMEAEIQSSDFTANFTEMSKKEQADALCLMAEKVFLPANPGWDRDKFFATMDIPSLAAAMRFFDRLRQGIEPADGTLPQEIPPMLEASNDTSLETPKTPVSIVPATTRAARRQQAKSR